MRNRAKCKLCGDVIESFHPTDYVFCKCNEIALDGGESLKCFAKDWNNFLRIDEEGREIAVSVKDVKELEQQEVKDTLQEHPQSKLKKEEIKRLIKDMVKSYENLPQQAMYAPVTHSDLLSILLLFEAWFLSEE